MESNRLKTAIDWALSKPNTYVWNFSFVFNGVSFNPPHFVLSSTNRYFDYIALNNRKVIVLGAGNIEQGSQACSSSLHCVVQNAQYNALIVGAYGDGNNLDRADDVMWSLSSWINLTNVYTLPPPYILYDYWELPHVVASGSSIQTLCHAQPNINPPQIQQNCSDLLFSFSGQSGTSFSTPYVAGLAAHIYRRNASVNSSPEAVRSMIMAGASNNVDGHNYYNPSMPWVDTKDGSNAIDACMTKAISDNGMYNPQTNPSGRYIFGQLKEQDFAGGVYTMQPIINNVSSQSSYIRAALVWNRTIASCHSSALCASYDPLVDLDLCLEIKWSSTEPWLTVKCSNTYSNPHEILEYKHIIAVHSYRLKILKYSTIPSSPANYFGLSWYAQQYLFPLQCF